MHDGPDDEPDRKTRWAESRTDWAEDRTILANERTFAGWLRTGMAAVAVAIGLQAVFRDAQPTWLPKGVATIFLAAALVVFWSARRNAAKAQRRLNAHQAETQTTRVFSLIAVMLGIGTATVGVILWSL